MSENPTLFQSFGQTHEIETYRPESMALVYTEVPNYGYAAGDMTPIHVINSHGCKF